MNLYIGYKFERCTSDHLIKRFEEQYGKEHANDEIQTHHEDLYERFLHLLLINCGKKIVMEFYSIEFESEFETIEFKERNTGREFSLKEKYEPLQLRYEVTSFTDFKPSKYKINSHHISDFKYDFVFEIKGEYAFILYNCDSDSFYLLKDKEVTSVSREQVILPNDEMFFWNKFDEFLEQYIISCLDGNTPSCLRIIADCIDEYSNSVLKPDCFGLDKLLQFDEYLCWNSYCFEDSVMEVTKKVLQRFV